MELRISLLFLLLGSAFASTHEHKNHDKSARESKVKPRYSEVVKAPHTYILEPEDEEHYGHHGGKSKNEEYINSEEIEEHREKEEELGNENSDKNVKDDAYDDHAEKGSHQEFQAGGLSFDNHLKDHKADNKEIDNVKAHDAGEKFGGNAVKEHKVGKHKEKSKGHKLHGFKNVYHKEEYGDHKTFHDEFLDSDHQHNYDDQHEHKEMQGGKFSKAYKHEGKNKKFDKGDEKREWRKEEFDGQRQGHSEKGGQSSRHRHGSKKHQGNYEANTQKNKNSARKLKKGNPPPYVPHGGHHGPHHAQIQPYVSHYNPHPHKHDDSASYKAHPHKQYDGPSSYKPHAHQPQSHYMHHNDDSNKGYDQHHNHHGHHSSHSGYHPSNASPHDYDHSKEFSHDEHDDDHDSSYEERTPKKHHHRAAVKEDKSDEKILIQKPEPVVFKHPEPVVFKHPEPVAFKHPEPAVFKQRAPVQHGMSHYRQPVYQEQSQFKQPDFSRQERTFQPFRDTFENRNQNFRYGYQQPQHQFYHPRHHHHDQHQQQAFPRFPGFSHNHHAHGLHHHGIHNNQFRHIPSSYQQEALPAVPAQAVVHITKPKDDDKPVMSQKQYE